MRPRAGKARQKRNRMVLVRLSTVAGEEAATLETGAEVKVPMFVEVGDVLQIDTRDGRFIKRM